MIIRISEVSSMTSTFFIMPGRISLKARAFLFVLAVGMPSAFGVGSLRRLFVSTWFGLVSAFGTLKTSLILAVPGPLCPRTWLSKNAGSRGCAAKFAVWRLVWKEIAIRFLPVGGAPVQLNLERAVGFNRSTRRARSQNDLRTLEMGPAARRTGERLRVSPASPITSLFVLFACFC